MYCDVEVGYMCVTEDVKEDVIGFDVPADNSVSSQLCYTGLYG